MALSLDKEQEKVKLSLEKVTKKPIPPVQVKLVPDVSGSMSGNYNKSNGYMYPILQRSIALASIIDPDKVVQIIAFDTKAYNLGDYGVDKFDEIWKAFNDNRFWGGTNYAAAFNEVLATRSPSVAASAVQSTKGFFSRLFGKKEETQAVQSTVSTSTSNEPELIIFFTDGANGGSFESFKNAIDKVLDGNTYLMCIGAGGSNSYYRELKDLADDRDDVGFVYFDDPNSLTDNTFYDTILSGELGEWLEKFSN